MYCPDDLICSLFRLYGHTIPDPYFKGTFNLPYCVCANYTRSFYSSGIPLPHHIPLSNDHYIFTNMYWFKGKFIDLEAYRRCPIEVISYVVTMDVYNSMINSGNLFRNV